MTDAEEPALCYIVCDEAWYRDSDPTEPDPTITVEYGYASGGCVWEFTVVEVPNIGVQVRIFDDAFAAFGHFPDLFERLALLRPGSLVEVRDILDDLGVSDVTARVSPYAEDRP